MDSLLMIGLLVIIGAAAGALIVWYFDMRAWGTQLKTARSQRNKGQATIQVLQARLQRAEKGQQLAEAEARTLRQTLDERQAQWQEREQELTSLRHRVQTSEAEMEQLHQNLNQVNQFLQELRTERQDLQTRLQTAVTENQLLREQIEQLNNQLAAARDENQKVCQRLAVSDVELKHLQADLAAALAKEKQAALQAAENEALQAQWQRATQDNQALRAQIEGALQQLTETQFLRKQLVSVQAHMKEATTRIERLQEKLTAVQRTMGYMGQDQLQIIRGIGPAYAGRLAEAGIHTLEDLSQTTPAQLAGIIQPKKWQNIDMADWIVEAKALIAPVRKLNEHE